MRSTSFVSLAAVLSVALCAPGSQLCGQQPGLRPGPKPPTVATSSIPPAQLLAFAQQHTGLGEVVGEPWHVKANFDILTAPLTGKFTSGTFEETWYAPQNFRRTYTYKGRTHTDYGTVNGLYRSGDQDWPDVGEVLVRELLVHPLSTEAQPAGGSLHVKNVLFGKVSMPCLYEVGPIPVGMAKTEEDEAVNRSPRICFEESAPIVRLSVAQDSTLAEVSYSHILNLHGHLVAQEMEALLQRQPVLRIHVLEASAIAPAEGPMVPPAEATTIKSPITLPWDAVVLERLPSPGNSPKMPLGAALQAIQDPDITVDAVISPEGSVTSAKVLKGELSLRQAALDSVMQSKFKPFLLMGQPVEVHTVAHITMTYGSGDSGGRRR